ncbi:hypothetical protein DIPPA_04125 [Diplonema papillatum]|nr:hypothetical protein DIPPA_04125 [Diplonema papillatum]
MLRGLAVRLPVGGRRLKAGPRTQKQQRRRVTEGDVRDYASKTAEKERTNSFGMLILAALFLAAAVAPWVLAAAGIASSSDISHPIEGVLQQRAARQQQGLHAMEQEILSRKR